MELSEAIRIGSASTRQCYGRFYDERDGACALGAAFLAIGGMGLGDAYQLWPVLTVINGLDCPECGASQFADRRGPLVPHLNDFHCWDRLEIADFVASVEAEIAKSAEPELETVEA